MIGPQLYSIGNLYLETANIFQVAEQVIKTLADMTGEATTLAIRDRSNVVFLMIEQSKHALSLRVHVGSLVPAHCCAIGRALMSDITEGEIDVLYPDEKLIPVTKKSIATKTELKQKLEQLKKDGVSLDSEGAFDGIEGIASEVRDNSGTVIAAIGIALPIYRMNQAKRELYKSLTKMGSSLISYRLGYNGTSHPVRDIKEIRSWWTENKLD
jgi:DNA-binding IclR family transcriptional regulator